MSNLQTYCHIKLGYHKVDQHTGAIDKFKAPNITRKIFWSAWNNSAEYLSCENKFDKNEFYGKTFNPSFLNKDGTETSYWIE